VMNFVRRKLKISLITSKITSSKKPDKDFFLSQYFGTLPRSRSLCTDSFKTQNPLVASWMTPFGEISREPGWSVQLVNGLGIGLSLMPWRRT
jgi:hypothetical protein